MAEGAAHRHSKNAYRSVTFRVIARHWITPSRWQDDERPFKCTATTWFETGTPAFLIETLFNRQVSSLALEEMAGSSDLLSALDVDEMATEALLFQTGYLTVREKQDLGGEPLYRLGYPNRGSTAKPEPEPAVPSGA